MRRSVTARPGRLGIGRRRQMRRVRQPARRGTCCKVAAAWPDQQEGPAQPAADACVPQRASRRATPRRSSICATKRGERVIAGRRTAARAAITEPMLRREVARDLDALMNTIDARIDAGPAPSIEHVRQLDPEFRLSRYRAPLDRRDARSTTSADEIEAALIELRAAARRRARSTSRATRSVDAAELKVRFIVRADLFCDPLNVPVEFVADVELDSGKIMINRL